MYLSRQRYPGLLEGISVQSLTKCRQYRPIDRNGFSGGKADAFVVIAGGKLFTMNFTQMHERLRLELLRRINRGTLSVSLLARQTGFGQPHLSNFLRCKRQLSLQALDRLMTAQHLAAEDLLPVIRHPADATAGSEAGKVPILSNSGVLFEPYIRTSVVHSMLHLPVDLLHSLQSRPSKPRRAWQRFVAIRISSSEAHPMDPLIRPHAIALVNRHYNSLAPYRTDQPNIFALRNGPKLLLRHVDFLANRIVLRPYNRAFPVELLELELHETPGDLIAGRIALIVNEL
jgi:hypothetical protein